MQKKIICILVCTLLIATTLPSISGVIIKQETRIKETVEMYITTYDGPILFILFSSTISAVSPMPLLIKTGKPHPKYSANLVGQDDFLEKQGFIKNIPTSAIEIYSGILTNSASVMVTSLKDIFLFVHDFSIISFPV